MSDSFCIIACYKYLPGTLVEPKERKNKKLFNCVWRYWLNHKEHHSTASLGDSVSTFRLYGTVDTYVPLYSDNFASASLVNAWARYPCRGPRAKKPNASNFPLLGISAALTFCEPSTLPEVLLPCDFSGLFGVWDPLLHLGGGMAIVSLELCSNKSSPCKLTGTGSCELARSSCGGLCWGRRRVGTAIWCCCCVWRRVGPPFLNLQSMAV